MSLKRYETVFILTPVLSDEQMKDTVAKFKDFLSTEGAKITHDENWGLKKLAYPIQKKTTGFYHLVEFEAESSMVSKLELQYNRDERVLRYLTTALDKYAVEYNEKRKSGAFKKAAETK